jgi:Tol biopolymer transport system component
MPRQPAFARLAVAWSPAGDRLAAVASDHGQGATQSLWVFDRGGTVLLRAAVGPNGLARAPRWTPDGRWLFLTTFPEGGRRIVAVEAATGRVLDLSQPRWDAFASLAPDGRRLLLWNGRGGFWEVTLDGS